MKVDKLCINSTILSSSTKDESDQFLGFKIFDRGLDGLKNPGIAGLSVQGKVIWSVNKTDGYESTFSVNGNSSQLEQLVNKSPWARRYDLSTNIDCQSTACEWRKIGSVDYKHWERGNRERFMEMSADGLTFAVGDSDTEDVHIFKFNSTAGWIQQGSKITTNQTASDFGHTVSLSADGSIVAVSAPSHDSDGVSNTGQVRVYQYNKTGNEWSQLGRAINTEKEDSHLGWHVSLSADGRTLAVSTKTKVNDLCHAFVYKYDENTNKWNQQGDCLSTNGDSLFGVRTNVQLSGTGKVVAVATYDYEETKVFKYNEAENLWSQKGSDISPKTLFFGFQLSLSSDGLTLAGAGKARDGVRVFSFSRETNDWEQKGQVITTDKGEYFDVALSSSGSILVVTYDNIIESFIYDELTRVWIKSLVPVPKTNYLGRYPRISVSADALVIAAREEESIIFFRLIRESSSSSQCQKDENFFNFTIKPDQFPQDVVWFLGAENGVSLLGGRLPVTFDESSYLTYLKCVPTDQIFTFFIQDDVGDGICCQWGNGTFQVEWNSEVALNSVDFKLEEIICLPKASNSSLYSIEIVLDTPRPSWILFDSDYNTTLMNPNSYKDGNVFKKCLPSHDCMFFYIFDSSGDGRFKIHQNDHVLIDRNYESFNFIKVPIGNCNPRVCPDGQHLFEIDIGANESSSPDALKWNLIDSNYTTLAKREIVEGPYRERPRYHHFQKCVQSNDCLTLRIDTPFPKQDTNYIVTFDGVIMKEGHKSDRIVQSVKMGSCD